LNYLELSLQSYDIFISRGTFMICRCHAHITLSSLYIHLIPFIHLGSISVIEIDEIFVEILWYNNMSPEKCDRCHVVMGKKISINTQYIFYIIYITYYTYNTVSKLHAVRRHHDYRPRKRQDKNGTEKYFQWLNAHVDWLNQIFISASTIVHNCSHFR